MKKIHQFQITRMTVSGFKCFQTPVTMEFGNPTVITGGNGRGKSSIADAIAFAITGLPFFGKRVIDKLYNETLPDISILLCFVDESGAEHELLRTRCRDIMTITYDGIAIRQMDLTEMFGDKDTFLSIFNPLYLIEELGENGRNLLESLLPAIPKDKILSQLPADTRNFLQAEALASPDAYLKQQGSEIRELQDHIKRLEGQREQAEAQSLSHKKAVEELTQKLSSLSSTISELEARRYSGMDIPELQNQLAESEGKYEEMTRDARQEADEEEKCIQALQEKIIRREAEKYTSPYSKALSESTAALNALGKQYTKESNAYGHLVPGSSCPVCHRPITKESLPEVQKAVKNAAYEIAKKARQVQSQIKELSELDQKTEATFEQYKADDLKKWRLALEEMNASRKARSSNEQPSELQRQIQDLHAELEYGNLDQKSYDLLLSCRAELKSTSARLDAIRSLALPDTGRIDREISETESQIDEIRRHMSDVSLFLAKRAELTLEHLKMNRVEISLYDVVKTTGEVRDVFRFTYNGRRYDRLSLSEKVRAGTEVSELIKQLTGRNYPVYLDNMESVDELSNVRPTGQIIMAKCVRGAALTVKPMGRPQVQKAA